MKRNVFVFVNGIVITEENTLWLTVRN